MKDIMFLTVETVIKQQLDQLRIYGGGDPGILNQGRLEAAVAGPQQTFGGQYLLPNIFAMGAAYLKYLVSGHAFANGNKRIALASALEFLFINGFLIEATPEELAQLVLDIACHVKEDKDAATFFQSRQTAIHAVLVTLTYEERLGQAHHWMHHNFAPAFRMLAQ